jgi:hypothetical protein
LSSRGGLANSNAVTEGLCVVVHYSLHWAPRYKISGLPGMQVYGRSKNSTCGRSHYGQGERGKGEEDRDGQQLMHRVGYDIKTKAILPTQFTVIIPLDPF